MFGFVRQPEPLLNRIPKAHCFSVSPTIGNTNVVRRFDYFVNIYS